MKTAGLFAAIGWATIAVATSAETRDVERLRRPTHILEDDLEEAILAPSKKASPEEITITFPPAWKKNKQVQSFFRPVEEKTVALVAVGSPDRPIGFVPAMSSIETSQQGSPLTPPAAVSFINGRAVRQVIEVDVRPGGEGDGKINIQPLHVAKGAESMLYNGTVAYETEMGGRSFWGMTDDGGGYEEWIYVPKIKLSEKVVIALYAIEFAKFAEELVDSSDKSNSVRKGFFVVQEDHVGSPKPVKLMEIKAPVAYDKNGDEVPISLEIQDGGKKMAVVSLKSLETGPFLVDPVWVQSNNMLLGRRLHTATLLQDGRVLVAGGISSSFVLTNTAEIYDPVSKTFTQVAPMPMKTRSSAQVLLDDGRVLITHGAPSNSLAVLYNVTSDSWEIADPNRLNIGINTRLGQRVVKLPNGQVLLTGNYCCPGNEAHLYDPATNTFHVIDSMSVHRLAHSLTALPDGSILAAGGGTLNPSSKISNTAERFVPDNTTGTPSYLNGSWVPLSTNMTAGHFDHEAALIEVGPDTGKVLICAGLDGSNYPSLFFTFACDLYDSVNQDFTPVGNIPGARQRGGTGNGGDFLATVKAGPKIGHIVAAGGWFSTFATNVYDPVDRTWSTECKLIQRRLRHQTVGLQDGSVAVFGGQTSPNSQALRDTERLSFQDNDDDCDGIPNAVDICPTGVCGVVSGMVFDIKNETCEDIQRSGQTNVMVRADHVSSSDTRYAITDSYGFYSMDLPPGSWNLFLVPSAFVDEIDESGEDCTSFQLTYNLNVFQYGTYSNTDFALKLNCQGTMIIEGQGLNGTECNGEPYLTPCPGFSWEYCFTITNEGSGWFETDLDFTVPLGMTYIGLGNNPCGFTVVSVTTPGAQQVVSVKLVPGQGNNAIGQDESCIVCFQTFVDFIPTGGWTAIGNATGQTGNGQNSVPCAFMNAALTDTDACGCDPNIKYVFPAGCDDKGTYPGGPLAYTVRFQNEGLGPAYDVSVLDRVDSNLDLETMHFRGSKYPVSNIQIDGMRKVYIRYEDIALPAAKDDFEGSQGFIHFDLEPASTTGQGTMFYNEAEIYFDQNEVVKTNQVQNNIGICEDDSDNQSGLGDGTNPGKGGGTGNSPNMGERNPNNNP